MQWPKVTIHLLDGLPQQAVAPLVISASRATDIPAFHAKWFMERLRAGYCVWENPFNSKQRQYISFENCRVFVFWTKNPQAFMPFLDEIEARGVQFYFQYTLNNYETEGLEPRMPKLATRCATFKKLSERIGKERVIWRFDPIILSNTLNTNGILDRIASLANVIAPYTEKLVFSFVDWYKKTQNSLKKIDETLRPPTEQEMLVLADGIVQINKQLTVPLKFATCAETIDLSSLGIPKNKCVDSELILRLCPQDTELHKFYGKSKYSEQASLLSIPSPTSKDSGQRTPCGCVPSKDIGSYNSCMHLCAYCYANQSPQAVINKMNSLDYKNEKL